MIYDFQVTKTRKNKLMQYLMQNMDHETKYSGIAAV